MFSIRAPQAGHELINALKVKRREGFFKYIFPARYTLKIRDVFTEHLMG